MVPRGESKSGTKHSYGDKAGFISDKYYNRNIDKIDSLSDRTYIIVGEIKEDSPLYLVGLPAGKVYFDISKIQKEMKKHGDVLRKAVMKKIPELLAHPIVITEYLPGSGTNTVNVFGNITTSSGTPIMVGVVMKILPGGVMISKIRTVHARSDFDSLITKDSILYLSENKKETKKWFEARGQHVPTGETQFGLIRRISYSFENVNSNDINDSEKLFHSYDDDINKTIDKWSREAKARAGRSTATGTEVGKAIIPKEKQLTFQRIISLKE